MFSFLFGMRLREGNEEVGVFAIGMRREEVVGCTKKKGHEYYAV